MIAIVTPYYQRQTGLLRRAVQSVLRQTTPIPWHMIIVDDGSPVPAAEELDRLRDERIILLRQENRGVSPARNLALGLVPPGTEIVAFLDSDDVWEEGHLERVVAAMQAGADFYFEDFQRYDQSKRGLATTAMDWHVCTKFDPGHDLHWYDGDFFGALLEGSPARTSTVAYRFQRMPKLRFLETLWYCEDVLFWMEASRQSRRIAVSAKDGAFCGKGINISEHSWGTLREVRHHLGRSRYFQAVRSRFSLTRDQDLWTRRTMRIIDTDLWLSAFAAGVRGRHRSIKLALSHMRTRPQAVSYLPAAMAKAAQVKLANILPR